MTATATPNNDAEAVAVVEIDMSTKITQPGVAVVTEADNHSIIVTQAHTRVW